MKDHNSDQQDTDEPEKGTKRSLTAEQSQAELAQQLEVWQKADEKVLSKLVGIVNNPSIPITTSDQHAVRLLTKG